MLFTALTLGSSYSVLDTTTITATEDPTTTTTTTTTATTTTTVETTYTTEETWETTEDTWYTSTTYEESTYTEETTIEPTTTTISNDPEDLEVVSTEEVLEDEDMIDLLEGDFITFNANVFTSEKDADEFIEMIENDEATKDRFKTEKEIVEDDFVLVRVTYAEDAEEEGRYILFYVAGEFNNQDGAREYIDHYLNIYPDIFVAGETITVDGKFDIIFGIRPGADTQAVTYDEETLEIEYEAERKEYTYIVKADPVTGEFIDPIQPAVEAEFPGEFTFTSEEMSENEIEVTMTPLKTEDDSSSESEESVDETETDETAQ